MADLRSDMSKALEATVIQLAHIRGEPKVDTAKAVATTCSENLRLSRGTSMEEYWRTSGTIADQIVVDSMRDDGR